MSFAANTQLGENGHPEYSWAELTKDRIVQFHFQCTRTDDNGVFRLRMLLNKLLSELKQNLSVFNVERNEAETLLSILYKMIGYTRDIIDGKGECTLTYMMIREWYNFYPNLALFALDCLVDLGDKNTHPYGSWKDIKYFCKYCREQGDSFQNPLLRHCIFLLNDQLRSDYNNCTEESNDITLVSKWIPREKSSFGWMYEVLATQYFNNYMESCKNDDSKKRAILKCKTQYRSILATLNKRIDTLQIKQCTQRWADIDFKKVTSISMTNQRNAFLNVDKRDTKKVRFFHEDRVQCAANYKEHIEKSVRTGVEVNGKRVSMVSFTKQALQILDRLYFDDNDNEIVEIEKKSLNSQWRDNSSQTRTLGKMVAMVDVSGSMEGDPINVAIALGVRIAEKSVLGKRVMSFSKTPEWVDLSSGEDFVSQVEILKKSDNWGMNTNFYAALDMILEEIQEKNLSKTDVEDMVLVILSDMQIDAGDNSDKRVMYEVMQCKYAEAGMRICGEPYSPPHILFWNLKNRADGFLCLSSEPNVSMMSGFSPALLNMFCEQGMEALKDCTPFNMLEKSLNGERYKILNDKFFMEI